jgi:glycosyltransferase involved in cell wall biosynthesis
MRKILLSAYACEPGKGSEPGVGWQWACGLADKVDLTVITRRNNREAIENKLQSFPADSPIHSVKFRYYDIGGLAAYLKSKKLLPTNVYYLLWQAGVARFMQNDISSFDIVHHLTFCTPLCPGFWPNNAKRVIGPVGAPIVNSNYLSIFGRGSALQYVRGLVLRHLLCFPWLKKSFMSAHSVVPANSETKMLLEKQGVNCLDVMLDTGVSTSISHAELDQKTNNGCRFLCVGLLARRKGVEFIIRAFARFLLAQNDRDQFSLTILGDGPDGRRLQKIASSCGVDKHIFFKGAVDQSEVASYFLSSDVFVFSSVRDTSGSVNLEAMACGLPILCLSHQGVADITDESCAVRVAPAPIDQTVDALADGMLLLASDSGLRARLGANARMRALTVFSWDQKFTKMVEIYHS